MAYFTRRRLAGYVSEQLIAGNSQIIEQLAAYLHESGRAKEVDLLVRDIENALEERGVVLAKTSSAFGLDDSTRLDVKAMLEKRYDSRNVLIEDVVDPTLLGGIKIRTAGEEFDRSLKRKINRLRAMKV